MDAEISIVGDWQIKVNAGKMRVGDREVVIPKTTLLDVDPAVELTVVLERYEGLPVFDPQAAGWVKGQKLRGITTEETTAKGRLVAGSLSVYAGTDGSDPLQMGSDYGVDLEWGTVGRLAQGRIGINQPVYISYRYGISRLDAVVMDQKSRISLRRGMPHVAVPRPPLPGDGGIVLAHLWVAGNLAKLTADHVYPILETAYPETVVLADQSRDLLPKTTAKLLGGGKLRILAWGDSVTDGSYLPDPSRQRWQEQFVARLRERYPQAEIELVNLGWGGRNTASFLAEPPGSPYNYLERVLAVNPTTAWSKPDLVISEFVNDAYLKVDEVETHYSRFMRDFQAIGAEWIILTPHYVRPDWMELTREKEIDEDPREYVAGLRQFARRHHIALADASLRWGRLWRQGIPYTTLLGNAINHPDERGMKLFADSLMALFG